MQRCLHSDKYLRMLAMPDPSKILKEINIGFVGGGNMAQAIAFGLLKKKCVNPENIWVSSRTEETLNKWKEFDSNIHTTLNNADVIENCEYIFLAVKPHILVDALKTCVPQGKDKLPQKLFISVLVGTTLEVLTKELKILNENPSVIRSMPNTPLMVSEGITVYCCSNTSKEDEIIVKLLFSILGLCQDIPESLMNSVGGLSGSGPAYAYMIIEALADGAVRKGVPRALANKCAAQVLVGAGRMVLETGKHPGQLKDEVCSPGGSTITGIHEMERGGVRASMMNAVEAAVGRSDELTNSKK
ncbi:pyrroline-5-carboxylate reductase 3 [Trichogramma pretiosum]|uniref:pyrroline-5-carboxylate reductase 3 n=1 Tax=Trichogramma pretiosum TaxID=7493 RepID=UPI0006C97902|nr:pyrroline-5-carboxylate reductase 3 [Trichogramma pretiosum]